MANHDLPRRGTAAANALVTLDGAGGNLSLDAWRRIIGWKGTRTQFDQNVIDRLCRVGLIALIGEVAQMSKAGYKFVGLKGAEVSTEPAQLAGPRYVAPMRPLDLARHRPPRPLRAGALDYLSMPSRMGVESVAYKGTISFAGDVE
jgi:hypothetical protein